MGPVSPACFPPHLLPLRHMIQPQKTPSGSLTGRPSCYRTWDRPFPLSGVSDKKTNCYHLSITHRGPGALLVGSCASLQRFYNRATIIISILQMKKPGLKEVKRLTEG